MKKKIVFIHSLNNFSGSPNILSLIISGFVSRGYNVDLITNKSYGFLSNIDNVNYRYTSYRWNRNKILTLLLLLWSQIEFFFIILVKYRNEKSIFYINTIVPFGAVWACRIFKGKIVYHIHENMYLPKPLYSIYRITYKYCEQKTIFVSEYLKKITGTRGRSIVIYNSLSPDFMNKVEIWNQNGKSNKKSILMVGSLRIFKGIYEFIELSHRLQQFSFELVVSASPIEVEEFKFKTNLPSNLMIFSQQTDLHPFYQRSKLLLQLSHPKVLIETFGLTILEAMVYGIPAIVPNIGGPTELIDDGFNGFTVDPINFHIVAEKVKLLMEDEILYRNFSEAAIEKSKRFNHIKMIDQIEKFIFE